MPSIWRWHLAAPDHPDRRAVHRVVSRWLDLDHHAATKPWSWSAHPADDGWTIDIGVLDDTLLPRLIERSEAYRTSRSRGTDNPPLDAPLRQIAAASWTDLIACSAVTSWVVQFTTPFTARRGDRFLPWPAPATVFGSLRATWRTYAAPHIGDLQLDLALDPLVVTAVSGTSTIEKVVLRAPPSGKGAPVVVTVGGFLGSVNYTIDGRLDPTAVESLTRLAPFCGVGAYTTRGFGAVRITARA